MGGKPPSPCIDICKFKLDGHCLGCGMTKKQKKTFKKLDGKKDKTRFIVELMDQQSKLGKFNHWTKLYQRKCDKKAVAFPGS